MRLMSLTSWVNLVAKVLRTTILLPWYVRAGDGLNIRYFTLSGTKGRLLARSSHEPPS